MAAGVGGTKVGRGEGDSGWVGLVLFGGEGSRGACHSLFPLARLKGGGAVVE